jgi:hypothetical protein
VLPTLRVQLDQLVVNPQKQKGRRPLTHEKCFVLPAAEVQAERYAHGCQRESQKSAGWNLRGDFLDCGCNLVFLSFPFVYAIISQVISPSFTAVVGSRGEMPVTIDRLPGENWPSHNIESVGQ